MQMVFQDPYASLDPRMNVERIITEGIVKFRTCPKADIHKKAVELMAECGLDAACLQKYPHQFSGGQRQRIGIAGPYLWSLSLSSAMSPLLRWMFLSNLRF